MFAPDQQLMHFGSKLYEVAFSPWKGKAQGRAKLLRAVFPLITLLITGRFFFAYGGILVHGLGAVNIATRLVYVACFAYGMEYVARYGHHSLWHAKALWWLHGSHHHVEDIPVGATPKVKEDKYSSQDKLFELNDVFPVVFAWIAILLIIFGVQAPTNCLCKDCCSGLAVGVTFFGVSYFVGHDLVAHERAGKGFAKLMRTLFPFMAECADVHRIYHHKIKHEAKPGQDPYGAPYGFWMGPYELAQFREHGIQYVPVPNAVVYLLKTLVAVALVSTAHYLLAPLLFA